ncbi:MAG: carbohydrate ABC transporter permease, partial [Deltaproteobacteria bacterium]|nr:carbohydrate ABC transporter permease [Deltaproteobacteria bacterium]
RQYFLTIPLDLAEAARVDGASLVQIFWRIYLPLSKPALAALTIFTFLFSWNDLLGPLIYLPANLEQTGYTREMHGVDRWEYTLSPAATCSTLEFYREQGGTCDVQPGYCTGELDEDLQRRSALAATCSGEVEFSAFVMGWEAEVYDYDRFNELFVSRVVAWTRSPDND